MGTEPPDAAPPTKRVRVRATRREKWIRFWFSVGGALGAVVLAFGPPIVAPFAIDLASKLWGSPTKDRAVCSDAGWREPAVGQELVDIMVSRHGQLCWARSVNLQGDDTFDVEMVYANHTGKQVADVTVQAWLPAGVELVAGTTKLKNWRNQDGETVSDNIVDGINVGNYEPGANAYLMFTVKVTRDFSPDCRLDIVSVYAHTWHPHVTDWVGAAAVPKSTC